jgi:hypothetical protein
LSGDLIDTHHDNLELIIKLLSQQGIIQLSLLIHVLGSDQVIDLGYVFKFFGIDAASHQDRLLALSAVKDWRDLG